jgi:antagonist of KipI
VLPGAIQVLPMGDWIVLGPDAGTMGGYPVAGVVCTADLDRFAHLLPGDGLELVATTVEQAPRPPTPEVVRLAGLGG